MKIADSSAFLDHKRILNVELTNGSGSKQFVIALNFSVAVYYKVLCLIDELSRSDDNREKLELAAEIVTALLQTADESINAEWVVNNISPENQFDLITQIMGATDKLLDNDALKVPEINIKTEKQATTKGSEAKERQKKKQEIDRLNRLLMGKKAIQLMDDISIVMTKTNNSYFEIMEMPILIFRNIVRTIIVNEQRTDDDYNLAYLKYECEKLKIELNSGKADEKPSPKKGADLKKLKAVLNM